MNIPETMKAARLYTVEDIRIEEMAVPQIGPGDILVKMMACGVCTGDIVPWYMERKAPLVLGHEPVGVVTQVGNEVTNFEVGDRVFMHHHAPCFVCSACQKGNWSTCTTWKATFLEPGGMSEYIRVPAANLCDTLKLPEDVSFEAGAFIEPFACSVHAMDRSQVKPGDTVVILGLGIMGMLNVIAAKAWGAAKVIGVDCVPFRLKRALELGVDEIINFKEEDPEESVTKLTEGTKADHVIVGPGAIPAIEGGLKLVGKGGTLLIFTPTEPHEEMKLKPYDLYMNAITVKASYSCGPNDTRRSLTLIRNGVLPIDKLVTHRFSLDETKEAFNTTRQGGEALKSLVLNS